MIGSSSWRIIRVHLLPNSMAPIIVSVTFGIPVAIFAEASLSFLGVGINPPMPSWGQMLGRDGITNMTFFWHLALFPAVMIALTMLGFTLVGDGLRDALDPKMINASEPFGANRRIALMTTLRRRLYHRIGNPKDSPICVGSNRKLTRFSGRRTR